MLIHSLLLLLRFAGAYTFFAAVVKVCWCLHSLLLLLTFAGAYTFFADVALKMTSSCSLCCCCQRLFNTQTSSYLGIGWIIITIFGVVILFAVTVFTAAR